MSDPGPAGDGVDPAGHDVAVQRAVLACQQPAGGARPVGLAVVGEELDEVGVQRDVAVVVQLAERDAQPVGVADDGDGVGFEVAQLTDAHPGAGEQLDGDPAMQPGLGGEGAHEPGVGGVVEEAGQRLVAFGDVPEEDRHPHGGVVPAPLDDAHEEHAQHPDPAPERRRLERTVVAGLGVLPHLERFDVGAADVGHRLQRRVVVDEEPGEDAQIDLHGVHGGRAQRHGDLIEVGEHRRRHQLRGGGVDPLPRLGHLRPLRRATLVTAAAAHRTAPRRCASIASAALRYSPASQSSARCRYIRVVSIEA